MKLLTLLTGVVFASILGIFLGIQSVGAYSTYTDKTTTTPRPFSPAQLQNMNGFLNFDLDNYLAEAPNPAFVYFKTLDGKYHFELRTYGEIFFADNEGVPVIYNENGYNPKNFTCNDTTFTSCTVVGNTDEGYRYPNSIAEVLYVYNVGYFDEWSAPHYTDYLSTAVTPCQYNPQIPATDPNCVPPAKTKPFSDTDTIRFGDMSKTGKYAPRDITNSWLSLFDSTLAQWSHLSSQRKEDLDSLHQEIIDKAEIGSGYAFAQITDDDNYQLSANNSQCVASEQGTNPCQFGFTYISWDHTSSTPRIDENGITFYNLCITTIYQNFYNPDAYGIEGNSNAPVKYCFGQTTLNDGIAMVASDNFTYGQGYEEFTPPTSINGGGNGIDLRPDININYSVQDKTVILNAISKNIPEGATCYYGIDTNPATGEMEDPQGVSVVAINLGTDCTKTVTHTWEQYGKYALSFQVTHDGKTHNYQAEQLDVDGSTFYGQFGKSGDKDTTPTIQRLLNDSGATNNPFAAVITSPIAALSTLANSPQSCNPLNIPLPFVDRNLPLPCMTGIYSGYFGSFFTLWQSLITGIVGYWATVRFFQLGKNTLDPDNDKVEVLAL